ncbi:hypothetical protein H4F98_12385 [Lysobacter spongiae]|uniref:Tetratricopeptide repeat protein n=2 Tax=Marilutibacter spongiae TaxID=2025720 RepID=A0A7W3TN32_9GAMM|nr:hypothetical protein [Lysobacter spongiae]
MRQSLSTLTLLAVLVAAAGCDAPATREATDAPPLFEDFGSLHRDIGTDVDAAQRYFDQGLRMTYGFNHEAAGRAFAEAARLDPACAMCAWGQALVLGPNINMPMDPAQAAEAKRLADAALALKPHATDADRALIDALATRYADPAPEDRASLDRAYADAMADAYRRFPADDDIATLYGEALMDLSPWAYWEAGGAPGANTTAILDAFEAVLARNPAHIGAAHYYIHAVEASPDPARAERHADRLATLAPGSGHLVHMPAHVYIRVGRYHDATLSNFAATSADEAFLSVCRGSNGVYPLGYVPHNWHFATLTAGLHGSSTLALQAAAQTARRADPSQLDAMNFMQQFVVAPLMTQVRFGRWDDILATSAAPAEAPYPTAIWHFARGMARVRTGALEEARIELEALRAIAADPAMAALVLWDINGADRVLAVAEAMLRGELALAAGDRDVGIAALREAAAVEDGLNYNEPADWPLPVRPYLGAALLDAGRATDAAAVYREDLVAYPENGWSLRGLALAEQARGDAAAAAAAQRRFDTAWQWADVDLVASRF